MRRCILAVQNQGPIGTRFSGEGFPRRVFAVQRREHAVETLRTAAAVFVIFAQVLVQKNLGPIRVQIVTYGSKMGCRCRLVSISYELLSPFHGGNTGSNPVG